MLQKLCFTIVPLVMLTSHAATNITFFGISDTHYGKNTSSYFEESRQLMPTLLNTLPGRTFPVQVGEGIVETPRGVLIAGDLTDILDTAQWRAYTDDYGVLGEKKLIFPTYEACGNHDFFATGSIKDTLYNVKGMIDRNKARRPYLTDTDSIGYHYSWDWDDVHFVNLNVYAGEEEKGHNGYRPMNAMKFLKADLEKNVGESGRPVFIMQHFSLDSFSNPDWSASMRDQLYSILKNYNVIGILHGHTHKRNIYKWNGIDVFDAGTVLEMDALVFHITDGHMKVANRIHTGWGKNFLSKTISMGTPRSGGVTGGPKGDTLANGNTDTFPKVGVDTVSQVNVDTLPKVDTVSHVNVDTLPKVDTVSQVKVDTLPKVDTVSQVNVDTLPKVDTVSQVKVDTLPKVDTVSQVNVDTLPKVDTDTLVKNDTVPLPPTAIRWHHTFTVSGVYTLKLPSNVHAVEILNLRGQYVNLLPVAGRSVVWDRSDRKGALVPNGLYFIRDAQNKSLLGKFILR